MMKMKTLVHNQQLSSHTHTHTHTKHNNIETSLLLVFYGATLHKEAYATAIPSVCLSVTLVYYAKTAKQASTFFHHLMATSV